MWREAPDLSGMGREGLLEKVVTGRSLEALDLKLFVFHLSISKKIGEEEQ